MNFKDKTIFKYFLITQLDLDCDVKTIIKQLLKIRIIKAPTIQELRSMKLTNCLYQFKNDDDITFMTLLENDDDITFLTFSDPYKNITNAIVKSITYDRLEKHLCFDYGQFTVYMSLKRSNIDDIELIKSSTPRLLYHQYQTEFVPNTIFYIL